MKLETKLGRTGKGILTGLALVLAGSSLGNTSYGAEKPVAGIERSVQSDYSIQDFKKAYGRNAWDSLDDSRKKATEAQFEKLNRETKKETVELYDNTAGYIETHLSKEEQKQLDNLRSSYEHFRRINPKAVELFKKGVDLKALKQEYAEKAPWVNLDNPSYDLDFIYLNELGKNRLNPSLLKTKYNIPY